MLTNLLQERRFLRVTWCDWAWRPEIIVRPLARPLPESGESAGLVAPMRNGLGMSRIANCRSRRNCAAQAGRSRFAFTLVELLVVMGIIAILAAMLVPAVVKMKEKAKISKAKQEISRISLAISSYETDYSRPPISAAGRQSALKVNPPADFTFGGIYQTPAGTTAIQSPGIYFTNNSEVIVIIMDLETVRIGSTTVPTVNSGHVKNTQKNKYLTTEILSDTNSPGVGADGVFRDPWGNPYIISLDANGDEKTRDAFYDSAAVSEDPLHPGSVFNGLIKTVIQLNGKDYTYYEFNGSVMVWSAGPDKKVDPNVGANAGHNKDNILSWKP